MPHEPLPDSPKFQRIARLRPTIRSQPGLRQRAWYPVLDINPSADPPNPRPGYVWLDANGEVREVWAKHLEIREG